LLGVITRHLAEIHCFGLDAPRRVKMAGTATLLGLAAGLVLRRAVAGVFIGATALVWGVVRAARR